MASKNTPSKKTKAKPAAAKPVKAVAKVRAPKSQVAAKPRHPKARVVANHGTKETLAKTIAATLAREDQDVDTIVASLKTASNQQLLRLARVTETVKQKYGSRAKLITAIGTTEKKSKDKDFLAKLDTYSLPQLLDIATSADRRAR
ncbi:MAG: hypothetical protein H0T79_20510 [Deltaproteobacteria bacterium]|nr:hypothetical protein [Deltaproteobacteria bacterium]